MKGKKVILKNPPGRMFCEYFARRPYPQDTCKTDSLARLFSFQSCASHVAFSWVSFRNLLAKFTCSSNACSILHQLNTKPNTIKFHKIQGTKLK